MNKTTNRNIKNLVPHFGYAEKNLYTWKELEGLLNLRPFLVPNRFTPAGPISSYTWFYSAWCSEPDAYSTSAVKDIISKSTTYLRDCSRVNEKVNSFAHSLEKTLHTCTDCHIYFSIKKDLFSFGKHKDTAHNLIVVSEGSINCEVWIEGGNIIEKELSNGDYVFIPAEVYHRITPLTEKRLSLSFCSQTHESGDYEEREWLRLDNL